MQRLYQKSRRTWHEKQLNFKSYFPVPLKVKKLTVLKAMPCATLITSQSLGFKANESYLFALSLFAIFVPDKFGKPFCTDSISGTSVTLVTYLF
jgi:hypothetical protein